MTVVATTLQVTDGTTTVDLSGANSTGTGAIIEYTPRAPSPENLADGVTEIATIRFRDTSISAGLVTLRNLEKLLTDARIYAQSKRGVPVYLKFKPEASETLQRSQIVAGKLTYDKEALGWQIRNKVFKAEVEWTRMYYWEAETESELTAGGGVAILNHSDAGMGHINYVSLTAESVTGVLPAPCRIEIQNTYGTGTLGTLWLGNNAYCATKPTHILEGEDAAGITGTTVDANSSEGDYGYFTTAGSTEVLAARWAITAAQAGYLAGYQYHLLLRAPVSNNGIYIRAKATTTGGTTALAQTQEVLMTADTIQDLGVIQLPPYLPSDTGSGAFDLTLYVRKSGGCTFYCDFIQLTGTDAWRMYTSPIGVPQNSVLKDDGILEKLWVDTAFTGGTKSGNYIGGDSYPMLYPGRVNRLYFLGMNTSNGSEIARTYTVKVFFRPRRITL